MPSKKGASKRRYPRIGVDDLGTLHPLSTLIWDYHVNIEGPEKFLRSLILKSIGHATVGTNGVALSASKTVPDLFVSRVWMPASHFTSNTTMI